MPPEIITMKVPAANSPGTIMAEQISTMLCAVTNCPDLISIRMHRSSRTRNTYGSELCGSENFFFSKVLFITNPLHHVSKNRLLIRLFLDHIHLLHDLSAFHDQKRRAVLNDVRQIVRDDYNAH